MDIPSSHAGTVKEVKVKVGDKVAKGSLILLLDEAESVKTQGVETGQGGREKGDAPSPSLPLDGGREVSLSGTGV
jgi:pyruvate/2-oxoglutarate dehydrogenase complex dihydrolipoamide acyltransferase (E2) component